MTLSLPERGPTGRLVVKTGSNLLTAGTSRLDLEVMASIVSQAARLLDQGWEVVIVSSGAIAAGRNRLDTALDARGLAQRQMLAAIGQPLLMASWADLFQWHGRTVAQVLLTRNDLSQRSAYLNARSTLASLLEAGIVPIINENDVVAIEEILESKFGDNDLLSALVAGMIDATRLVILTDQGGLYSADPRTDPGATLIRQVDHIGNDTLALAGGSGSDRGTGGMATKLAAAQYATASGIDTIIAGGHEPEALLRAASTDPAGTRFLAQGSRLEARKRWLLSGLARRGAIRLDPGAVRAVAELDRSLLPAGIVAVEGSFRRGDTITLTDDRSIAIGYGTVNYDASDVAKLCGVRSDAIEATLGYTFGDEVVHRNNLVLAPERTPTHPQGGRHG